MLQISNVEESKSEWNVNETHIIIPMIDGDVITKDADKITTNTITFNALEGGDQTILTNGLEHSFVIGLDRNLFETHPNKSDLLVIQNSDLKLLDLKNPVTYTLSYVDQDRGEILWESPVLKERSKPEYCAAEKAIFEVKDVLNYDDSKHWRDDLEKSEEQIILDDVGGDLTSQVTKIDGQILLSVEESTREEKKQDLEKETHYIVNYFPSIQNCDAISILPNSRLTKSVIQNPVAKSDTKTSGIGFKDAQVSIVPEQALAFEGSAPLSDGNDFVQCETEFKENLIDESSATKDTTVKGDGVSRTLPEKSLPLKKKAKMKRTMVSSGSENLRSVLKQDAVSDFQQEHRKSERKAKHLPTSDVREYESSDSDEPLMRKVRRWKRGPKAKNKMALSSPVQEEMGSKTEPSEVEKTSRTDPKNNEPTDIYGLVEGLRKCRIISASIWQTLHSGLKELRVDILKEMNAKRKEKRRMESSSYSAQLKAFALVLYFKKPAAFKHLAKVYGNGWPSLKAIKEWKTRMNSRRRLDD